MPPEFDVFERLKRHGIPFVIVGGHAVNYHGYIRATEDADVVWLRSPENEEQLHRALVELDANYISSEIDPITGIERTVPVTLPWIQNTRLMMLYTKCGFLDLFDYIPGIPQADPAELMQSSLEVDGLRFASLDWLRKMKRAAGRDKDLLDLKNLPD